MLRLLVSLIVFVLFIGPSQAQESGLQAVLQNNQKAVERASRKTVDPLLDALVESRSPAVPQFLEKWRAKDVWLNKQDGRFYYLASEKTDPVTLVDIETGEAVGTAPKGDMKQLKPNSGVREVLASALVRFQLQADDKARRIAAVSAIERSAEPQHLDALRKAAAAEADAELKLRMDRLVRLLAIRFDPDPAQRVAAIRSFSSDTAVDVRAALNPLLATTIVVADKMPEGVNLARHLTPGANLSTEAAYDLLVEKGLAPAKLTRDVRDKALLAHLQNESVAGIPRGELNTEAARSEAYALLAENGLVPPPVTQAEIREALEAHVFLEVYAEPDTSVTNAARESLASIENRVDLYRSIDLGLDALSLASIYFLAAIGLAITFGVMGVINMAHGEFIMIGAYTGYVVQQVIPDYTISIIVALPLAFLIAFAAGVALERLVIRHLVHRPLETLLATFGISIALQQLAKNIFGTQARPLTSPAWLDGAWVINDVISISLIRIAIFVLALGFLGLLIFVLTRTRFGLEVRAVTQNPRMASSMGINPDRINMLTFGLGSGIAGIAGVAIGLFAKVTSELGSAYIVQSFMTVVVGGVGNIWGTLAGAGMIGSLQKAIEFLNPSNTLAAQTYMIIFIIIFIQFRPKGIIALKGRAAGD